MPLWAPLEGGLSAGLWDTAPAWVVARKGEVSVTALSQSPASPVEWDLAVRMQLITKKCTWSSYQSFLRKTLRMEIFFATSPLPPQSKPHSSGWFSGPAPLLLSQASCPVEPPCPQHFRPHAAATVDCRQHPQRALLPLSLCTCCSVCLQCSSLFFGKLIFQGPRGVVPDPPPHTHTRTPTAGLIISIFELGGI